MSQPKRRRTPSRSSSATPSSAMCASITVSAVPAIRWSCSTALPKLASLVRHAIRDDMATTDFRVLSVIGAVCFFIGKQCAYFMERPELRGKLIVNTLLVFVLAGSALLLPRTNDMLFGLTATVICYAFLSFRYQKPRSAHHRHPRDTAIANDRP